MLNVNAFAIAFACAKGRDNKNGSRLNRLKDLHYVYLATKHHATGNHKLQPNFAQHFSKVNLPMENEKVTFLFLAQNLPAVLFIGTLDEEKSKVIECEKLLTKCFKIDVLWMPKKAKAL